METLGLTFKDDTPSQDMVQQDAWLHTDTERKMILKSLIDKIIEKFVKFKYNNSDTNQSKDLVVEYEIQLLNIGLFYLEFQDGIKEGDGERVLRCWKYLLPIFLTPTEPITPKKL